MVTRMRESPKYQVIIDALKRSGVTVVVHVSESWLGGLTRLIAQDPSFSVIAATHEEEAVSIACGAAVAGKRATVICQNAGILSAGCSLAMVALMYHLPITLLLSYRGTYRDPKNYHIPKGKYTEPVLRAFNVSYAVADHTEDIGQQVEWAVQFAHEGETPFALLVGDRDLF